MNDPDIKTGGGGGGGGLMGEIKCRLLMVSVLHSVWLQQHSLIYTFIYPIGCIF